jgi:hypothetical protein
MSPPNILALDPGRLMGVADTLGGLCTIELGPEGSAHEGTRLARLRQWLRSYHAQIPIEAIVMEDPAGVAFGGQQLGACVALAKKVGVVQMVCTELEITNLRLVNVSTLKRFAGARKKAELIRRCKLILGVDARDDNQADARWLLEWAIQCWRWPGRLDLVRSPLTEKPAKKRGKKKPAKIKQEELPF